MYGPELKELGLTDNEIKIYLALLHHGALNPTQLAEKTGLHRSYVYDTTEKLLEKGIINTVLINKKRNFQVIDPKVLRGIFELKLRHLDTILPQLSSLYSDKKEETRVELHKGKKVFETLFKDIIANLKNNDLIKLVGVDEEKFETVSPIYLKQYFRVVQEKKSQEMIIIAKNKKRLPEPHLTYKELDKKYFDESTFVVHRNKTYILIWGNPYHLIIIENEKVANTYRKQFDLLWSIAN